MHKKYWIAALIIILTVVIIKITINRQPTDTSKPGSIKIVATFYPLAYIAEQVGGANVQVINITPPGTEPHEFEPTPRDIAKIYEADVFIVNGLGMDAWAEKLIPQLQGNHVTVIRISDQLTSLGQTNSDTGKENNIPDPHFWLDPLLVSRQADIIAEALIAVDPAHTSAYNEAKGLFKTKLSQLDQQYTGSLATCQSREIITTHNAFAYLANRYNLTTFHILGLSPEEEPSPKTIAQISQLAKEKHINYIFFETALDQKLSTTIAQEIGAQSLVLNPIESLTKNELASHEDYLSVMNKNLQNLKTALVCL